MKYQKKKKIARGSPTYRKPRPITRQITDFFLIITETKNRLTRTKTKTETPFKTMTGLDPYQL